MQNSLFAFTRVQEHVRQGGRLANAPATFTPAFLDSLSVPALLSRLGTAGVHNMAVHALPAYLSLPT
jgi:hypothetical protein